MSVLVDLGGDAHTLPGPWHTLADVITAHKAHRWHWFDRDEVTLRIVDHRIHGGRLFVSSEWPVAYWDDPDYNDVLARRWTVKVAHDDGAISDASHPHAFASADEAHVAAYLMVRTIGMV